MPVMIVIFSFLLLLVNLGLSVPGETIKPSIRVSFIYATLIFGAVIALSTEVLSFFSLFRFAPLLIIWVGILLGLLVWLIKSIRAGKRINIPKVHPDKYQTLIIISASVILIILGVLAYVVPSSNYDSMTYHMSRVMHWIENGSVAPYPTNISRQVWQNPFAEYSIAQLMILSQSDRFANFVQFFSMIASCIGASLIAKELGNNNEGQLTASILVLTIPMGILQSTSTQNDYVVAYWMVCFIFLTFKYLKDQSLLNSLWLGLSLGLAMLTKALAYVYAAPFVLLLAVFILVKLNRRAFINVFVIVSSVLFINASFIGRNYSVYGNLVGTDRNTRYTNESISVSAITSNMIKNTGLHTWTPFSTVNDVVKQTILLLHDRILHIAVDDPRTTYARGAYTVAKNPNNEDFAGNPFHLVLIFYALIIWLITKSLRGSKSITVYALLLSLAFIIFSGYLKWQPFNSRLELTYFVLWTPFISTVITHQKSRFLGRFVPALFLILALPWVLLNYDKPIIPNPRSIFALERSEMLFYDRPDLLQPYSEAIDYIKSVDSRSTGILLNSNDWEYPLWAIANYYSPSEGHYAFHHVILNEEGVITTDATVPEYIISSLDDQITVFDDSGRQYEIVWKSSPLVIFKVD